MDLQDNFPSYALTHSNTKMKSKTTARILRKLKTIARKVTSKTRRNSCTGARKGYVKWAVNRIEEIELSEQNEKERMLLRVDCISCASLPTFESSSSSMLSATWSFVDLEWPSADEETWFENFEDDSPLLGLPRLSGLEANSAPPSYTKFPIKRAKIGGGHVVPEIPKDNDPSDILVTMKAQMRRTDEILKRFEILVEGLETEEEYQILNECFTGTNPFRRGLKN